MMPQEIGPFRVVRLLGEGGVGVVYLAERLEDFTQRVAIKMLHPHVTLLSGESSLRQEEEVLVSLDHPAIVRLLDTGEQDGRKYITMEYVEGLPLDIFSTVHTLNQQQRILLLLKVLDAVEYAHRHLVIHADLKPANILVTKEGWPKLLDFGVSVLSSAGEQAPAPSGYTSNFASPEQHGSGRATVAMDIYSMGRIVAVLFGPGTEQTRLSKDLSHIVQVATRPEPEDRYASIPAFSDDLRALLEDRPVAARRGGTAYRVRKWVRRRRLAAALVAALVFILVGSSVAIVVQTARATQQRRNAQARLQELIRLTGTLDGELYESAHTLAQGQQASASLLQASTNALDSLSDQSEGDSTLVLEVAEQYLKLAQLERKQGDGPASALDREKAMRLLKTIPAGDPQAAAARALQQAATVELQPSA